MVLFLNEGYNILVHSQIFLKFKKRFLQKSNKCFSSMALKPVNIRWFRTGSQPDRKSMYSTELQTIFYKYQNKNHIIFHFGIRRKLSVIRCDKHKLEKRCYALVYLHVLCFYFLSFHSHDQYPQSLK